jgi:uroporphyrinogen decarboxylase
MNKEQRILDTINRKAIDFLPSQITFSDRTRMESIARYMGFKSADELEEYLQNHIKLTYTACDMPLFNRNNLDLMKTLEKIGYAKIDWENRIVFDAWGVGVAIDSDGIFPCYHPLQSGDNKICQNFLPEDLSKDFLLSADEDAIKAYKPPDPNKTGNLDFVANDLKKFSGDFLVITSGYGGIYERAYFLMGYEEFMTNLALNPSIIEDLLDKITDYKIEIAKGIIKAGCKVGHNGDDLGTQTGSMFSRKTFQKILMPRMARLWSVYKDAGIPVIFHSCGNITEFIPDLIEIGLDVLEPVQPVMDLKYIKKEFGKYITFWGGIDTQKVLPYGTPQQVKELASDTIRTLGKGGGYIIATAQEVMKDVPLENVKALVETIIAEREAVLNM